MTINKLAWWVDVECVVGGAYRVVCHAAYLLDKGIIVLDDVWAV